MTHRSRVIVAAVTASVALTIGTAPAGAATGSSPSAGPSDTVAQLTLCDGGFQVGIVRFRDEGAQQRLRVIVFSGGPPDVAIGVEGRDISGPGLPGTLTLDGGGGGRLDLRGEFSIGADPAINLLLGGSVVVSTDPAKACPATGS